MAASTRDRIVAAARSAFATRGVDGTAITDLEEAAGLAPGSGGFYRYFKTKDEVLLEVVRREIDRVLASRPTSLPPSADDLEAELTDEFAQGLELLHSLRTLMAILTRERGRIPEVGAEVSERLLEDGLQEDADRLAASIGGGDGADADADVEHLRAVRSVITSALVGYTLAADYFGTAPGGITPDRFAATLAALVASDARPR